MWRPFETTSESKHRISITFQFTCTFSFSISLNYVSTVSRKHYVYCKLYDRTHFHFEAQPVPYEDLPVVLPQMTQFKSQGTSSPLASAEDWVKVKCPRYKFSVLIEQIILLHPHTCINHLIAGCRVSDQKYI